MSLNRFENKKKENFLRLTNTFCSLLSSNEPHKKYSQKNDLEVPQSI